MPQNPFQELIDKKKKQQPTVTPSPTSSPYSKDNPFQSIIDQTPTTDPQGRVSTINPFQEAADQKNPNPITKALSYVANTRAGQATISTVAPVLDFISRPTYASARFADALANDSKSVLEAISEGFSELTAGTSLNPEAKRLKLSYSDVIRRKFPEFANDNPAATQLLGFVGDVALDPLTYFGAGTAKQGIKVGGKVLTDTAETVVKRNLNNLSIFNRSAFVGKSGTLETLEDLAGELVRVDRGKLTFEKGLKPIGTTLPGQGVGLTPVRKKPIKQFQENIDALPDVVYEDDLAKFGIESDFSRESFGDIGRVGTLNVKDISLGNRVRKEKIQKYATSILRDGIKRMQKPDLDSMKARVMQELKEEGLPASEFEGRLKELTKLREQGLIWDIDPVIIGVQPDGRFVALNGNNRIATLRLAGYEGDIPVVFSVASSNVPNLPENIIKKIMEPKESLLNYKYVRSKDVRIKGGVRMPRAIPLANEVADSGYFVRVADRQKSIQDFYKQLVGDPNAELARRVAIDETVSDLKRFGKERIPHELFELEVYERMEQRIQKLADLDPKYAKEIFATPAIYAKVGLPFGQQKDALRLMGLEGVYNRVKAVSAYIESSSKAGAKLVGAGRTVAKTFSRNFGLPEEYIKMRDDLENELSYVINRTLRDTFKLFEGINKEGRERIRNAMAHADDHSRYLEELRMASGSSPADDEYAFLFNRALDKYNLTEPERAAATMLQQSYKEAALLETRAGLLKANLVNYTPRGYELVKDAESYSAITRGKYNPQAVPQAFLASNYERQFLTNMEAEAAGLVPELDAAILYAHRIIQSRRALAIRQFEDSVQAMWGVRPPGRTEVAHTGVLPTTTLSSDIPRDILDDMRMIGESILPRGFSDTAKAWVRGWDRIQSLFKVGATTARPTFTMRQVFANTFQAAMVSGARAFKAFDPRVGLDAAMLLFRSNRDIQGLPNYLNSALFSVFGNDEGMLASRTVLSRLLGEAAIEDFAKGVKIKTTLGTELTGTEIVQFAREKGIIREMDTTGERFSRRVEQELEALDGNRGVAKELSKFWRHASYVEDYSRMMLFINGLRMGKSADQAAKLVNEALFDYSRGLSGVEKFAAKRIVPFYSFQRFALPFVFKNLLRQPGNAATMEKAVRTIEKLLVTGETLTAAEQNTFGDSLLWEQPVLFNGFDEKQQAGFNILQNLTPFDVLNFFIFDKKTGGIDFQRSVEKSVLGALTPFAKLLLGGVMDKDFFTDKVIKDASVYGDLEGSIGLVLPDFVKKVIGWETRYNSFTGKTSTYVSPFMGYYPLQFMPFLRDYIRPFENTKITGTMGALEASMKMVESVLNPFKEQRLDFKSQMDYTNLEALREVDRLMNDIKRANLRGSKTEEQQADEDLNHLLMVFDEKQKARAASQGQVRGLGIGIDPNAPISSETVNPNPTLEQLFK